MKGSLKKISFILILAAGLLVGPALGQYLYLIENNCSSDIWIDSHPGCVFNSTAPDWRLSGSEAPAYEDFTTYTELIGSKLTETSTRATFTSWSISDEGALYTSKNSNASFTAYWAFNLTYIQNANPGSPTAHRMVSWANSIQPDYYALKNGNYEAFGVTIQSDVSQTDDYYLRIWEIENGNGYISALTTALDKNTQYYLKLEKNGAALNLTVYTDPAYSVYEDHSSHTMQAANNNLAYLYGLLGVDYASSRLFSGYIEYLTFESPGGYESEGWLYSEDLLVNTTMGPAYVYCSGQEVPAGTGLTVAFSSDNSTWVRETSLSTVTGDLKESIFLEDLNYTSLYVRYNLTSNGLDTPKVENMAMAYEIDEPGEGANGWIYLLAAPISLLLGFAARKPI